MLRHNFLLIYRNFRRFKSTFFINLVGLSTGLACTLLIYLWVKDELAMDKFHAKRERLYRVMTNNPNDEGIETSPTTQAILGEALSAEIPEFEDVVTALGGTTDLTLSAGERHIMSKGTFTEKAFFKIFSYDLVAGSPTQVLPDKKSIVISEATAIALFNSTTDAVGRQIEWTSPYGKGEVNISGVFRNIPYNSSYQFDFLMHIEVYKDLVGKESLHWGNFGTNTYAVLKPNTDVNAVNLKIRDFVKHKSKDSKLTLFLARYDSYYLFSDYKEGVQSGGRIEYVRLFSLIGIFILVIACINFMNLSTAKATRRVREVGVKKAMGAGRGVLMRQYLGESMSMTFLSILISILMVDLLLPSFNEVTGKHLSLVFDTTLLATLFFVTVFTGLLAGSYPAIYLSGFNPATVLRGGFTSVSTSVVELFARKGLIIFQFAISVVFIVGVWIIYKQIDFVQTKNLGYDKDHLIYIKPEGKVSEHMDVFIQEVKKLPSVLNASSIARTIIGAQASTVGYFHWEGKDPNAIIPFEIVNGNYDLIETLGVSMKEGRSFSRDFASDSSSLIFNEAAIAVMGMKEPLGKTFNLWGKNHKIIGVTKDFHFQSLHEKVKPLFFRLAPEEAAQVLIKIAAGKEREALQALNEFNKDFNPGFAIEYTFLDKDYQAQYNAEMRVATLSRYFAGLAIIISCLGLFGLAAFTAERRLKEIGIRKVLGSDVFGIVYLLSADFTKMVLIASAIALPISYFMARQWLSGFAYKITLAWWYFPAAGALAIVIAWLTVGLQSYRAARTNPVKCLRDD